MNFKEFIKNKENETLIEAIDVGTLVPLTVGVVALLGAGTLFLNKALSITNDIVDNSIDNIFSWIKNKNGIRNKQHQELLKIAQGNNNYSKATELLLSDKKLLKLLRNYFLAIKKQELGFKELEVVKKYIGNELSKEKMKELLTSLFRKIKNDNISLNNL